MADNNFTLDTFYNGWKHYQDHLKSSIAPLTAEQLALRPAPDLRSVGEITAHLISCRAGWFTDFLGEKGDGYVNELEKWDAKGAPVRTAAELAQGLERSWQHMMDCIARWTPAQMQETFPDNWDGKPVELSRAWVVWHVLEHDLHHGG